MAADMRDTVKKGLRKIEEVAQKIPGYSGYKDKELRREADKLLRMRLARDFEVQLRRIGAAQLELTMRGKLNAVVTLERATLKLQLLIDRIKTGSYGYSGFFDAVKIREEQLDALYEFDSGLAEGVTGISDLLDELDSQVRQDEAVDAPARDVIALLEELNNTWSHRNDSVLDIDA